MPNLSRRVAVMDNAGIRLVFYAQRDKAELLLEDGLATWFDPREIRLTLAPRRAIGQSLPQYHEGNTMMLGKYHHGCQSFVHW